MLSRREGSNASCEERFHEFKTVVRNYGTGVTISGGALALGRTWFWPGFLAFREVVAYAHAVGCRQMPKGANGRAFVFGRVPLLSFSEACAVLSCVEPPQILAS